MKFLSSRYEEAQSVFVEAHAGIDKQYIPSAQMNLFNLCEFAKR